MTYYESAEYSRINNGYSDTLEFLQTAIEALDQAQASMRDMGMDNACPKDGARFSWREIFPHAPQDSGWTRQGFTVDELMDGLGALIAEVRKKRTN